ncbi:hypothetical protein Q7P36_006822 [Cladosporium allicinum]
MSPTRSRSIPTLIATLLLTIHLTLAQTYVEGTFQAAIYASSDNQQPDLTSAANAICPANYPQSCSSIGEGGFCCPSNTFCQYADNKQVGCCSALQGNCKGSLSGGNAYQSTSQYIAPAATTTWATSQAPTQYVGGAVGNYNPTTTVVQQGGFCTTIIAQGDNLPTIANARCGTALVVEAGADRVVGRGILAVGAVVGLQVLGGWVVLRRW